MRYLTESILKSNFNLDDIRVRKYNHEVRCFDNHTQTGIYKYNGVVTHEEIVDSIIRCALLPNGTQSYPMINTDGTITTYTADFVYPVDSIQDIPDYAWIQLKPNTQYSLALKRYDNSSSVYCRVMYPSGNHVNIYNVSTSTSKTFTTDGTGKILLYPFSCQNGRVAINIFEGDCVVTNFDYLTNNMNNAISATVLDDGRVELINNGDSIIRIPKYIDDVTDESGFHALSDHNIMKIKYNYYNYGTMYRNGYSYIRKSNAYNNHEAELYLLNNNYLIGNENIWYNTSDNKFYAHIDFRRSAYRKNGGEYTVEYMCKEIHIKYDDANSFVKIADITNNNEHIGVDIQLETDKILALNENGKYSFKVKLIDKNALLVLLFLFFPLSIAFPSYNIFISFYISSLIYIRL